MKIKNIVLLITAFVPVSIYAQTAREISEKSAGVIDYESMEMVTTLKIYDAKGGERIRQVTTATKKFGETNKTMIKIIGPPEVKGTAILIFDHENISDDMWIYIPAIRRTRRIVNTEKGRSFMGSEYTNIDMSKPNLDDFQYRILGTENYEGALCWKIESVCKNETIEDENGFSKKISYIQQGNYLCHKIEIYDLNGELHKTQYIRQYKKQPSGKYFAYHMEMKNEQNGRKSVLIVDKFQPGSDLPESAFTTSMLEK
ncbi:MAG: outer membrane lipoprotein-sorting protein [Bacteroidales bacterium]|nr:outer membrane lipoprotein-sorting protein [Bacteroidales bacterium]